MPTTRTTGPLHFEDLEPHRFEDLIRQLAYDYRPVSPTDPAGRTGSGDRFDARGWEAVPNEFPESDEDDDEEDDADLPLRGEHRIWLIQCKREASIGPKQLDKYLNAIPVEERKRLYGLIFAA